MENLFSSRRLEVGWMEGWIRGVKRQHLGVRTFGIYASILGKRSGGKRETEGEQIPREEKEAIWDIACQSDSRQ